MPHQKKTPVAVIVLNEPKFSQKITINHQLLLELKVAGISHVALLPLCPEKIVSVQEAQFVPMPGEVMRDNLDNVQDILKSNRFTLVKSYSDLFKESLSACESYDKIILTLQNNIDNIDHNYRYVIFDDLTVLNTGDEFLSPTDFNVTDTAKSLRLGVACENYLYHLHQPKVDSDVELTKKKIGIVMRLHELTKLSTPESLKEFGQILIDNRVTLEARRDSNTMIFMKVLLSIFTLGIAVACGLWEKEGEKVTSEFSSTLSISTPG
ncbi:MAG: hypothetical protein P1U74_11100 [Legionellaceae bacterium]|nr:hypothetical protein [Legionellaceae bacterium]